MKFFKHLLLEGEPDSALAGGGTPPAGDLPPTDPPAGDPPVDLYDGLEVKWPEGFDNGLAAEPSLKPFVDKESGVINFANVMKSYVHTKKQIGSDKITIPGEHATAEELDNFHSKLGYELDEEKYSLNKGEESLLSDEVVADFKKLARENRLPAGQAQKMMEFMENHVKTSTDASTQQTAADIKEGLEGLQTEWGAGYQSNLGLAQRVLTEVVADDSVMEALKDPRIGSNPAVIKALTAIGKKVFSEDGFKGDSHQSTGMTPEDATIEINNIMGDRTNPYWNKSHPGHNDAVKRMLKLQDYRKGRS